MTKAEILEKIVHTDKLQQAAITEVNRVIRSVSMSDDATALAAILHTMNGCLCDTLSILALILCEMLPDPTSEKPSPEPHRSKYDPACLKGFPKCQCLTCAHYRRSDEHGIGCCMTHRKSCRVNACPDYVKEDSDASV